MFEVHQQTQTYHSLHSTVRRESGNHTHSSDVHHTVKQYSEIVNVTSLPVGYNFRFAIRTLPSYTYLEKRTIFERTETLHASTDKNQLCTTR